MEKTRLNLSQQVLTTPHTPTTKWKTIIAKSKVIQKLAVIISWTCFASENKLVIAVRLKAKTFSTLLLFRYLQNRFLQPGMKAGPWIFNHFRRPYLQQYINKQWLRQNNLEVYEHLNNKFLCCYPTRVQNTSQFFQLSWWRCQNDLMVSLLYSIAIIHFFVQLSQLF